MTSTTKPKAIWEALHAVGGLDVGTGGNRGTISQILVGSKAIAGFNVSSIAIASTSVSVTGAAAGDFVMVSISSIQGTLGACRGTVVTADYVRAEIALTGHTGALLATISSDSVVTAVVLKIT
jgi:hypothetical protein